VDPADLEFLVHL
jgi:hypothetical protein